MTVDVETRIALLAEVSDEMDRAHTKFGAQTDVPDGTSLDLAVAAQLARIDCQVAFADGAGTWLHILDEEFSEAVAEVDPERLRAELIQVAAVALRWADAIDHRGGA